MYSLPFKKYSISLAKEEMSKKIRVEEVSGGIQFFLGV